MLSSTEYLLSTIAVSFYSEQISCGVYLEVKFGVTLDEESSLIQVCFYTIIP